jgi:hypothetical protein
MGREIRYFASCCVAVLYSIEVRPEQFNIFHSSEANFHGTTTSSVSVTSTL